MRQGGWFDDCVTDLSRRFRAGSRPLCSDHCRKNSNDTPRRAMGSVWPLGRRPASAIVCNAPAVPNRAKPELLRFRIPSARVMRMDADDRRDAMRPGIDLRPDNRMRVSS